MSAGIKFTFHLKIMALLDFHFYISSTKMQKHGAKHAPLQG